MVTQVPCLIFLTLTVCATVKITSILASHYQITHTSLNCTWSFPIQPIKIVPWWWRYAENIQKDIEPWNEIQRSRDGRDILLNRNNMIGESMRRDGFIYNNSSRLMPKQFLHKKTLWLWMIMLRTRTTHTREGHWNEQSLHVHMTQWFINSMDENALITPYRNTNIGMERIRGHTESKR